MSYILDPDPRAAGSRGWAVWAALLTLVVAAAMAAYLVGRHHSPTVSTQGAPAPRSDIEWARVGPWPVPISPEHGPSRTGGGLASGFSHDSLGAALAAWNISLRMTAEAGPSVYTDTIREQAFGDIGVWLTQVAASAPGVGPAPTELYYRVVAGDPSGESVLLSLAQRTPESAADGGYDQVQRTLIWRDGDWRVQVPAEPGHTIASVDGYQLIGVPHD
jgi:hypothetical protein